MTQLYRHFDDSNKLMYVGISLNTFSRLSQHKDHSHWFRNINRVTIEHFKTREEAMAAERTAIRAENPMFNIAMKKTAREVEAEERNARQLEEEKIRQKNFLARYVEYRLAYEVDDVRSMLKMSSKELNGHIEKGNLSVFYIEKKLTRRRPDTETMKPMVSGWALIDFVSYLEKRGKKND
jgi:hypothetical protein